MSLDPNPQSSENVRLEGNELFKQKKYELAIVKYTQALQLNPECHLSLSNRCQCCIMLKNAPDALQDAQQVVQLKPDWAKGWYRLGVANEMSKSFEEAATAFLKAYELDNSLKIAKDRHDSAKLVSTLSPALLDKIKNGQMKNMGMEEIGQLVQNDAGLMNHAHQKLNAADEIAKDPQAAMEKIKRDLKQSSEVWMISWSTTPYTAANGGRMYVLQIGGDKGSQIFSNMFETEPTSADVITSLQTAMLSPLDFFGPRVPGTIGVAYRMNKVFDSIEQMLNELNVKAMLEPIKVAKLMAEETGNHWLGLNHLVHENHNQ